jgi:hypothetical protein
MISHCIIYTHQDFAVLRNEDSVPLLLLSFYANGASGLYAVVLARTSVFCDRQFLNYLG